MLTHKTSFGPMRAILALILLTPFALSVVAQETAVQSADNVYVGDGLVYYSLVANAAVADSARTDDNWDIIINGVEVHANRGGTILKAAFDTVSAAPESGLKDGPMKTSDGDGWYNYDMNDHLITPKTERTLVIELTDGTFAKLEFAGYNHRITGEPRFVSFRYVTSAADSRSF
ncbi:MAG: hypothetical protein ACI80V_002280 [Rhodothermales bacterium]